MSGGEKGGGVRLRGVKGSLRLRGRGIGGELRGIGVRLRERESGGGSEGEG